MQHFCLSFIIESVGREVIKFHEYEIFASALATGNINILLGLDISECFGNSFAINLICFFGRLKSPLQRLQLILHILGRQIATPTDFKKFNGIN